MFTGKRRRGRAGAREKLNGGRAREMIYGELDQRVILNVKKYSIFFQAH